MNAKQLIILCAMLCSFAWIANSCSKGSDPAPAPSGPSAASVKIQGMSFSPSTITVSKGMIVTWTNSDGTAHTVTSNDGTSFDSGTINASGTFSLTANTAGTFNYHCTIHGLAMSGVLVVNP